MYKREVRDPTVSRENEDSIGPEKRSLALANGGCKASVG